MELFIVGVITIVLALYCFKFGYRKGESDGWKRGHDETSELVREYFELSSEPIEYWYKE